MGTAKAKHVTEVGVNNEHLAIREPFTIETEKSRRFVRLEISAPLSLHTLKDIFGNFTPEETERTIAGTILNISAGGILVEIETPVNEGDIVAMDFVLQGETRVGDVLGLVKRCEPDEDGILAGIEFIDRGRLADVLSEPELDLLPEQLGAFHQSIQEVLQQHLYAE